MTPASQIRNSHMEKFLEFITHAELLMRDCGVFTNLFYSETM